MQKDLTHSMYRVVYRSVSRLATQGVPLAALGDLLEQCLARNAALHVTGALAYDAGRFIQVLEGPADAVDALFARIGTDARHAEVELLVREPAERRFATWSMAFVYRDPRLPIVFARLADMPAALAGREATAMLAALVG